MKGIAKKLFNYGSSKGVKINSSANFNASGNIMSLLYGDDYKDKVALPSGSSYTFIKLFYNITHLINAENLILPAIMLTEQCYRYMFDECSSLTTAPELPATTLINGCYERMFERCSKLNSITMLATDISAPACLRAWVSGVSSTGTFTKSPEMTTLPTGDSGIPYGWTVVDYGAA